MLAGAALVLSATIARAADVPHRFIAAVPAFGSRVLISALSFDLMDEVYGRGGFAWTAAGFLAGATVYTAPNWVLARHGAKHRKRAGQVRDARQPSEARTRGAAPRSRSAR